LLAGLPEEGPGPAAKIVPLIIADSAGDSVSLRFVNPRTTGEKLLNQLLDEQTAKLHITDPAYSDYLKVSLKYASPTLISVEVLGTAGRTNDNAGAGAADGAGYFDYNLNIDMRGGRQLTLETAFVPDALPRLQKSCFAQLKSYFARSEGETPIEAAANRMTAKAAIADLTHWSFGSTMATITMDPGDEDPYSCSFDYPWLRKFLKPGFPLPK
jgi:hypothetical protein